ncbi:uncharacterized protein LOC121432130 isoform X2 [Lytechinus variegatus]|uniref:uncharacterized protein LOC121432130 isoform X2 n=1 Tax=Lytechinus variegatus TaxID=7654 RepID=UPI001BB0EB32|nr:uncharacterized protein LOC121432130 isoform X2 [Lytechinus variegatus]
MQVLGINILGILLHVAALANSQNVDGGKVGNELINLDNQYNYGENLHLQENHARRKRTMADEPPFLQNTPSHASSPLAFLTSSSTSSSSKSNSPSSTTTNSRNPAFSEVLAQFFESSRDGDGSPPVRVPPERLALSSSSLSLSSSIPSVPSSISRVACGYCVRRPRQETIGYDTNGNEINLDVGTCRKRIRKKFRSLDSSRHRCSTCGQSFMCVPSSSRLERLHLPTGSSEHRVIDDCTCRERSPPRCVRRPHVVVFSPNSRYETAIDVGTCEGTCLGDADSLGCRPVTNKTVALRDPNGARTVQTIQDCACTSGCFRVTHMESIYTLNTTGNQTQVVSVDLDVGKCVGKCPPSEHCVIPGENGTCKMALTVPSTSCHAKTRQKHSFTLPDGRKRNIYSIIDCACPPSTRT